MESSKPAFTVVAENGSSKSLFHCVNREVTGTSLLPTCEREVNGRTGKFLFAATHISKALAFAFDYHSECPSIILNCGIQDSPDELAIICKRRETLATIPKITVYSFSREGFEEVSPDSGSRQFVSDKPLSLSKANIVLETQDPEELMRKGLQIFSTEKTFSQLGGEQFFSALDNQTTADWLQTLLQSGDFRWENQERNINPTHALVRALKGYRKHIEHTTLHP